MTKNTNKSDDLLSDIAREYPHGLSEKEAARLHKISQEFVKGIHLLLDKGPFVTVFGSSRMEYENHLYKLGIDLGRSLAKNGFSVLTGGGPGLMEAVNRGAKEENGTSMGINISIPDEQEANIYANPSITLDHFFVRKVLLLKYSTAYIFLPGGYGTLDELFETVTLMQTKKIKPFPMVLLDSGYWAGLLEWLRGRLEKENYIAPGDMDYLSTVDSVEEAIDIIKRKNTDLL